VFVAKIASFGRGKLREMKFLGFGAKESCEICNFSGWGRGDCFT
jgi:hypothetical protein